MTKRLQISSSQHDSSTAIVSPNAKIGAETEIGPYCVIEANVTLGERCKLHSHVVIHGNSEIGNENGFFPFAAIGIKSQDLKYSGEPTALIIGDRNVFAKTRLSTGELNKIPQLELAPIIFASPTLTSRMIVRSEIKLFSPTTEPSPVMFRSLTTLSFLA